MTNGIILEVLQERDRQRTIPKAGKLDTKNTKNDWVAYITAYAGKAVDKMPRNKKAADFRTNMIKTAALCLAAVEAYDEGYC